MKHEDAERRYAQIEGERDYYKRLAESRSKERDAAHNRIAELEEREQALAAHVEKLHGFLRTAPIGSGVCCCGDDISTHASPMSCGHSPVDEVEYSATLMMDESPVVSLARRDLIKQAEALERLIQVMRQPMHDGGQPWLIRVEDAQAMADELRQRAQELK